MERRQKGDQIEVNNDGLLAFFVLPQGYGTFQPTVRYGVKEATKPYDGIPSRGMRLGPASEGCATCPTRSLPR
jgi:hypothetical protein